MFPFISQSGRKREEKLVGNCSFLFCELRLLRRVEARARFVRTSKVLSTLFFFSLVVSI